MLGSSPEGLRSGDVLMRRQRYGSNEPLRQQQRHLFLRFVENFTHTLALLLWFGAGLAVAAGILELALAIVAVIVVNGVFAFIQEYRAERVVAVLVRSVAVRTVAKRDGAEHTISASELVPGDLVRFARGDVVSADCVLIAADSLSLDLSSVTGESIPIERAADAVTRETARQARIHDLPCVAPASAVVLTGSADALVVATGPASTLGQHQRSSEADARQIRS